MIDIISAHSGLDLGIFDTDVERAKNILSIQIDSLEFIPEFGIDLKYFLSPDFEFQNASFKSYLVQRLATYGVNVTSVLEEVEALSTQLIFNIGSQNNINGGLVAR